MKLEEIAARLEEIAGHIRAHAEQSEQQSEPEQDSPVDGPSISEQRVARLERDSKQTHIALVTLFERVEALEDVIPRGEDPDVPADGPQDPPTDDDPPVDTDQGGEETVRLDGEISGD